jgi:hypothetical protein
MLSSDLELFQQAVSLASAGEKVSAYRILSSLATAYPLDANVLLWMAFTAPDLNMSKLHFNQASAADPANSSLESARQWLATEEAKLRVPVTAGAVSATTAAPASPSQSAMPAPVPAAPVVAASTPAIDPAVAAGNKRTNLIFGIAYGFIAIAIVGLVVFVLFTFIFVGDKIAAQGLPVYQNSTRIELSSDERNLIDSSVNFLSSMTNGAIKDIQYEIYKIKRSDINAAIKYYDTELKKMGWSIFQGGSTNITSGGYGYMKDKKMFIISTGNNTSMGFSGNNSFSLKSDETILVVMTMEVDMGKLTSFGR